MLSFLIFLIGFVGAMLVSYGAWLLLPSAGFIVAGTLCLIWSYMLAKTLANVATRSANDGGE